MKKSLLLFLFFIPQLSFSQLKINYINTPPQIDGDLRDWEFLFNSFSQTSKLGRFPNTLYYNLGFNEEYLYGAFRVKDKYLTDLAKDKSGSPRITFNDSIEFYIDTQNNSKGIMDDDDFQVIIDFMGNLTVFRGGDKYLIKIEKYKVPKDTVTNHFVMDYATKYEGTINDNTDLDLGYIIEFKIAWTALGIRPKSKEFFKIDICLNDADEFLDIRPLNENDKIPNYTFQSISGSSDFGFPNKWTKAILYGNASNWTKVKIIFVNWIWLLLLACFLGATWLIFRHLKEEKEIVIVQENIGQLIEIKEDLAEQSSFQSKCMKFILENLDKDISPSELAENMNMSLRQLQREFKEEVNITPTDFIRKIKLEEAAKLLISSKNNIAEIAYSLGFSDPAYFSRIFKKHYEQTPRDFQESAQKK